MKCGACVETCPEGAIYQGSSMAGYVSAEHLKTFTPVITNRDKCTGCQMCIIACYSGAREFAAREVTVDQVMVEIEREIPFYDESDGGVTFSGGEPLMQVSFLSELLKACRRQEIHTVVDTSGFANWNVFDQIRADVNLFLYDLKHMDSDRHREVTGLPNELILENLRRLVATGGKCIVRIPLIPGINDDEKNLMESGKFIACLGNIMSVELMGYHDIAQGKYDALDREYQLAGTKPPTQAGLARAAEILGSCGLSVRIR